MNPTVYGQKNLHFSLSVTVKSHIGLDYFIS